MIKFCVLGSGSKGNCVFMEIDGDKFLLDAGLPYQVLKKRLSLINKDINTVQAVFVTHEHNDHCQAIPGLTKNNPDIKIYSDHYNNISHGEAIIREKYTVEPFLLSHDTICHGFRVEDHHSNALVYVTDTGIIPDVSLPFISTCNALILEFNYDVTLLTDGPYPIELQERIFSDQGHLLNEDAGNLIDKIAWPGLLYVVCCHLSSTNNNADFATYEAQRGLGKYVAECQVCVAQQNCATDMMVLI